MKKKKGALLFILMAVTISACGNKTSQTENEDIQKSDTVNADTYEQGEESAEAEKKDSDAVENGDIIFETEYKIEDYCDGAFIVSKSDGLLYGVLNMKGEEILPVEYDNIYFINDDEVKSGENANVYILTTYEDKKEVYDVKGNKLFDEAVDTISYEIGTADNDAPFFITSNGETQERKVYKENGDFLFSITLQPGATYAEIHWINPNLYLIAETESKVTGAASVEMTSDGVYLCDANGNTLQQWDGGFFSNVDGNEGENYWIYLGMDDSTYSKVVIDPTGNVNIAESGLSIDELQEKNAQLVMDSSHPYEYYIGENKDCKIYQTNDTWKYEDASGNPVYDERYFTLGMENGSYLFSNSDNQVCVITPNGKKTVDYGYIDLQDLNYNFQGIMLSDENLFADYNSVCFVENNNGMSQVCYFGSE